VKKSTITLCAVLGSILTGSAHAALVAGWNFDSIVPTLNDSATGPVVAASTGTGSFQGVHDTASDWVAFAGNGSAGSYGGEDSWTVGSYYQFTTATTGYEGITISVDQASHPNGPRDFQLFYSTDGTNFTSFGSVYAVPRQSPSGGGIWSTTTRLSNAIFSFDLSGITDLDDAENVYFRITQMSSTTASGGTTITSRSGIDNVMINGTAIIPEPSAMLLGAIGLFGVVRRRRC
jgi:hypothetical protein